MPERQLTRRKALTAIGTVPAIGLAGCIGGGNGDGGDGGGDGDGDGDGDGGNGDGGTPTATEEPETVRAAWVYISEVGDLGWSWAHDQGRQMVDEKYDWLETEYAESVFPADGRQVMAEYTQQGFDVIFGTTFEYMDDMLDLAQQNPDTIYEHCSGYLTHDNMGRYFGRIYQARYLAGVAAGLMSEENLLGYVAAFPIPEVIRGINAFTAGARSVNEEIETEVRWTNTWFDPPQEREAAEALIDVGVDVMAQHQDSPAAVQAAANADIWATGYDAPMNEFGGERYITSPIWHWEVFYDPTLVSIRDGSWESNFDWEGLESGLVDLSEWGPQVTSDVKETVSDRRSEIENGELDVWAGTKFEGESDEFLFQEMGSYVEGVRGEVPD